MKRIQGIRKMTTYILAVVYVVMAKGMTARAGSLKDSVYVTGTKKLAADALVAIQVVAAVAAVAVAAWNLLRMKLSEDTEEGKYRKKAIGVVIIVIIIETIGSLFGIIGGYYGVQFS